jgi:putative aldouronate transport system substrate-binding protein
MKKLLVFFVTVCVLSGVLHATGSQQSGGTSSVMPVSTDGITGKLPVEPIYDGYKAEGKEWWPIPVAGWTKSSKYPNQPPISGKREYPVVKDTFKLKVGLKNSSTTLDYEDNDLTRFMEKLTNIHIEWEILPESNPKEKINLMFAAGSDLPDVFMGCGFMAPELISYGSSKMLLPLQDLIENTSYFLKKRYEALPELYRFTRSADGNIYTLGRGHDNLPNLVSQRFWINKTFLGKLGMKMPTTTEEYYQYLVAVKTKDPNGNGKADEIPLIGAPSSTMWHGEIDGFLMNAFIYDESATGSDRNARRRVFWTGDGKVDVSFTKPEWKDGLAYMRKLYAEGLMAIETFTIQQEGLRSLVENADALIVGSLPSGGPHVFALPDGERRGDFQVVPPLKGPKGVQQTWYDQYGNMSMGDFVITSSCKVPELVIKWADYMVTPDFTMKSRYGWLGRDWEIPVGKIAVDGNPAPYEETGLKLGQPQKVYWGNGYTWTPGFGSYGRTKSDDPYELEFVLYEAMKVYWPYRFMNSLPRNLPYTVQEARRYNELTNLIVDYVDQSMALFITGRLDLNKDWDKYIADLNTMGLDEWLGLIQSAWDRFRK